MSLTDKQMRMHVNYHIKHVDKKCILAQLLYVNAHWLCTDRRCEYYFQCKTNLDKKLKGVV